MSNRLIPQPAQGGLQTACLLADARLSDRHLAARAAQHAIDLPLLSQLYLGEGKNNAFVMGFSALAPSAIRDAMTALAAALRE